MNRSEPQPRRQRRRRRSWPRTILLIVFVLAILAGIYACLVRKPQVQPDPAGSTSQDVSSSSSASSEPTPVKERKDDFFTILVSGTDDGNGCADTNILVGFDAKNQAITCVSIPRDTGVYIDGKSQKVNAAYGKGGMALLADTVSDALGIPVDFTVEVSLEAFVKLVDEIGGVDFYVPLNMNYDDPYEDLHIHFSKGTQHLNGRDALKVVRFRHNNDGTGYGTEDIGRIGTQQAFLKAVAKQLLQIGNVKNIPALVDIFYTYVKTDLTTGNLVWLGNEALNIGTENIHFATLPGDGSGYYNKQSVYVLDAQATCDLVNEALNPYNEALTLEDMDILVP